MLGVEEVVVEVWGQEATKYLYEQSGHRLVLLRMMQH